MACKVKQRMRSGGASECVEWQRGIAMQDVSILPQRTARAMLPQANDRHNCRPRFGAAKYLYTASVQSNPVKTISPCKHRTTQESDPGRCGELIQIPASMVLSAPHDQHELNACPPPRGSDPHSSPRSRNWPPRESGIALRTASHHCNGHARGRARSRRHCAIDMNLTKERLTGTCHRRRVPILHSAFCILTFFILEALCNQKLAIGRPPQYLALHDGGAIPGYGTWSTAQTLSRVPLTEQCPRSAVAGAPQPGKHAPSRAALA